MRDQNSTIKKAGATSAGTTYTTALDTLAPLGVGNVTSNVQIFLDVSAIEGLSDAKTVIFTLQDSADNSTFADVADAPIRTFTGTGGTGAPAAVHYTPWLGKLRRYVRWKEVVVSSPGTITAYNYTWGPVLGGTPGL